MATYGDGIGGDPMPEVRAERPDPGPELGR